ncbi:di-trans,poly-cis-decaprenylcistransferase [Candidatus Woesearchaeota archaeon]|nr:di-trans,poly-cis-decaprenylcistransferase [Candidatus Woesearchaeota archaeon]
MAEPKHIAIILDGNRRFAKRLMAKPWEGHEFGAKKVEKLLKWCMELGIKEVTLYAFSLENFHRPKKEFNYLMKLFRDAFEKARNNKEIHDKKIRIRFLGRIELFPDDVQAAMRKLTDATKTYDNCTVNFCMAYGGRQEIIDASTRMAEDLRTGKINPEQVNEETFKQYLYLKDEPDMIIRTGGEKRMSGFLLYQSNYSELFFISKMWPEFQKKDLIACVEEFKKRERRFGR